MSVKSRDPNAPTPLRYEPSGFSGLSIGIAGAAISAIFWIFGARWTIDGLFVIGNALLRFLAIPYQAPVPPHYLWYAVLFPLPVIFSAVEWRTPLRREGDEWTVAAPGTWLVWLTMMGFDLYTTFLGLGVDPGSEGLTFMRQLATSQVPRALIALVLTVGPEWLGKQMVVLLRSLLPRKRK